MKTSDELKVMLKELAIAGKSLVNVRQHIINRLSSIDNDIIANKHEIKCVAELLLKRLEQERNVKESAA